MRAESPSMTTPVKPSSTSITTSSIGSRRAPVAGSCLKSTRGRLIETSKPSRRMVSMRTPSWSSPRPATSKASCSSDSLILIATLPSASRTSRAPISREVRRQPSLPESGESLTEKVMAMVGGSIGCAFKGSLTSGAHSVSATVVCSSPAIAMMSPASARSIVTRSRPRKASSLVSRPSSMSTPSRPSDLTGMLSLRNARIDAPGEHPAEIGIILERARQHGEGAVRDRPWAAGCGR